MAGINTIHAPLTPGGAFMGGTMSTTEPTVVLTIRVTPELRHELRSIARQFNRSTSEAAAWLLDFGISAHYLALGGGKASEPPPKRTRKPADPEVRRARASKAGKAGGKGRGKGSKAKENERG